MNPPTATTTAYSSLPTDLPRHPTPTLITPDMTAGLQHPRPEKLPPKPLKPNHHVLVAKARFWRFLMQIGMAIHKVAPPLPLSPAWETTIHVPKDPANGEKGGKIPLAFYAPRTHRISLSLSHPVSTVKRPLVVNFHGGGFTIGNHHDDCRWSTALVQNCGTIVCSVGYRLAPEYAFPTAVEDGVRAIMWCYERREQLGIDISKIAISGFSAGGNLSITVPLLLAQKLKDMENPCPGLKIRAVVAHYPSTDFTRTRAERRASNLRPDLGLPQFYTDLFDWSYIGTDFGHVSPYAADPLLSPLRAPEEVLLEGLPSSIQIIGAEFDELRLEEEKFAERLRSINTASSGTGMKGKRFRVDYVQVKGEGHAWDRGVVVAWGRRGGLMKEVYGRACEEVNRAFDEDEEALEGNVEVDV
ncbi:hypothetical protein G7K_5901-t1 [Saitoella complicata NRRL Y-17804]|uniref:Alpha/beta hydrolase fold-3 domain-containing protein n=2 Tax=Saitoella complicata (strain BCRC 22490 / CBS 7301 / JCM 7358 / NBRC 10748 / NRRL Y-17804) TaxID=698492 RepID=A0A0E9NQV8_SAICN|nr:hypothetical protein G7K_5901-t1 [Saitoella complicata NRRL Y-17804]